MADKDTSPWHALHMEIGRVAQLHVRLDMSLRGVYVTLATPSLAIYLVNDISSTAGLVSGCRTMLKKADIAEPVRSAGLAALEGAHAANTDRNRVVHDMWLPDFEGDVAKPTQWSVSRIAKGTFGSKSEGMRDLKSVEDARHRIIRANLRVLALDWALHQTLTFYLGSGMPETMPLEQWIDVMEDRFDLLDDGGFRPHSMGDGEQPFTPV